MIKSILRTTAAALAVMLPATAFAHHPLAGAPMETFTHGLLSGVGHPLLGFDHLFFVLLAGVAAVFTARRFASPAAYVAAMLAGCLMMSSGVGLPFKELVIAASLVVLGAAVLRGKALGMVPAVAIFAGFGLFHGSAFGDTIATQEAAMGAEVLIGYLIGLGALQYGMMLTTGWLIAGLMKIVDASDVRVRLAGAMVAGTGIFLTLESLEGYVFSLLGLAS